MCKYPIEILPKDQYVQRINVDTLCNLCTSPILVRRLNTDENPFHYIGNRKILNEGVIDYDVLNWSTNLLGGKFQIRDVIWKQKAKGLKEWNNENVELCEFDECYELTRFNQCVYIEITAFHKVTIPYRRRFGSEDDYKKYADKTCDIPENEMEQFDANSDIECKAIVTVEHSPIMLNYWHMTVEITPKDFEEPFPRDGKSNKSLKKKVKEALHSLIIAKIICDEPLIKEIPHHIYVK